MTQIFAAFLLTSALGTALALILTLLKPLTRNFFSATWHYYMWLIVLLVMVLPIKLHLPEKPVATPPVSQTITVTDTRVENAVLPTVTETQTEQVMRKQPPQTAKVSATQSRKNFLTGKAPLLTFIWLAGAVFLLLTKIAGYVIFHVKLYRYSKLISCPETKAYTSRKIKARVSDTIASPLMIGIIRPTLILPAINITPEQLHNVLAHEMTHLRRNDILYKWFVTIVKCIHWFNPAIYFISRQISIDCEISCDLAVIKEMGEQAKKGYVETILSLLTHHSSKAFFLTTGMTGNKKTLKKRFDMIKKNLKISKKATIISGILAVLVLTGALFASGVLTGTLFDTDDNLTLQLKELTDYPLTNDEYGYSFVGTVLEETTTYMIVEPIKNKADGDMGDKVRIEYGTDHIDYLYGKGRKVVIYFKSKPAKAADGLTLIRTDDISTDGFREFELGVSASRNSQKRLILSGKDIQKITGLDHLSNTNLYYYGLYDVMITIKGFTTPLETALENGRITLDGIIAKCNQDVYDGVIEELSYDDGGSSVYRYPGYTIIKYHTLDGNRDIYIGNNEMDINIAKVSYKTAIQNEQKNTISHESDIKIKTTLSSDNSDIVLSHLTLKPDIDILTIKQALNNSGITISKDNQNDLSKSYILGKCKTGDNIKVHCDNSGNMTFHFDATENDYVDIIFTDSETGDIVAEYGVMPDMSKSYSFMGFEKGKEYSIEIQEHIKNDINYIVY